MLWQGSTTADMSCPQRWQADSEPVWFDEFVLLYCGRVPQLLTCLVRNEGKLILNLLSKIGSIYPQAIYFPIRTLYVTLKIEQRERCKSLHVSLSTVHYEALWRSSVFVVLKLCMFTIFWVFHSKQWNLLSWPVWLMADGLPRVTYIVHSQPVYLWCHFIDLNTRVVVRLGLVNKTFCTSQSRQWQDPVFSHSGTASYPWYQMVWQGIQRSSQWENETTRLLLLTDVIHYLVTSVAYRRTHLLRRHCNCQ